MRRRLEAAHIARIYKAALAARRTRPSASSRRVADILWHATGALLPALPSPSIGEKTMWVILWCTLSAVVLPTIMIRLAWRDCLPRGSLQMRCCLFAALWQLSGMQVVIKQTFLCRQQWAVTGWQWQRLPRCWLEQALLSWMRPSPAQASCRTWCTCASPTLPTTPCMPAPLSCSGTSLPLLDICRSRQEKEHMRDTHKSFALDSKHCSGRWERVVLCTFGGFLRCRVYLPASTLCSDMFLCAGLRCRAR